MRIQKAPRNGTARVRNPTALSTHERVLWRDIGDIVSSPNKEIAAQLYVQRVMSPLLGPKHVDAGVGSSVSLSDSLKSMLSFWDHCDFKS